MKRRTKIILIIVLVIIALPIILWVPIKRKGVAMLKEKVSTAVHEKTNGRYRLELGNVSVMFPTATVSINDLHFTRDSSIQDSTGIAFLDKYDVEFSLEKLVLGGINWRGYLTNKNIGISEIGFETPDLVLRELESADKQGGESSSSDGTKVDTTGKKGPDIRIGEVYLENGSFNLWEFDKDMPLIATSGMKLNLGEILQEAGKDPEFPLENLEALIKEAEFQTGQYSASIKASGLALNAGSMHMDSMYYGSRLSPAQLNVKFGVLKSWIQTTLYDVTMDNFDLPTIMENKVYHVGRLNIPKADFHLIRDRQTYEPPDIYKPLPVELVHSISVPLTLDSLVVSEADVKVEILSPKVNLAGLLTFMNSSLVLTNFTNQESQIAQNPILKFDAQGLVMGDGKVELDMEFQLNKKETGDFKAHASFAPMPLTNLNVFFEREVLMRIASGSLKGLDFQFNANNQHANGTLDFEYSNLKLTKLSPHREFLKDKPKSGLVVALANLIIPKNHTSDLRRYSTGTIDVDRNQKRDVTDFVVSSLADGIMSSWGFDNLISPGE